ncbi:hypothetical protein ACFYNL_10415 [Streptomyces sp. NPDC007808]|uniref:hypothetical protein n=1 Tax=Streptomyces sp. NPDC007808 TaxID=3364779 RepID=UPI0036790F8F
MTRVPDLPVPPPFMWACRECAHFLTELGIAFTLAAGHALYDGSVRCQLLLAAHLASRHAGDVPDRHQDCAPCDYYRQRAETQGIEDLWLEHRARDLFLPAEDARLL